MKKEIGRIWEKLLEQQDEIDNLKKDPEVINYELVRPDAKPPERAHEKDAGMDVFWCPENISDNYEDGYMNIPSGVSVLLETGLKFEIPKGYFIDVCNRSSWAYKKQLIVGSHVIDSGYEDEVYINLQNIGKDSKFIEIGDKIAQLVMKPVVDSKLEEVDEVYKGVYNERGQGGFGSTGDS